MVETAPQQEVRAQAKWVRTAPRKARLVVEHIRGRTVPEARTVLAFTTRAAARDVEKVLRSAVANAEANHGLVGDDLYVSAAFVDEGPTLKRWRARARGRAARIHKHTCHITIRLAPVPQAGFEEAKTPPKRPRSESTEPRPKTSTKAKPTPQEPQAAAAEKPKRARTPRRKKTEEADS
jgi:large subunit ribosomal protein L22